MLKNVLLGMGITLIIISLFLMVTDTHVLLHDDEITNDDIIKQARKLGMFFPGQDYYKTNPQQLNLERKTDLTLPQVKPEQPSVSSPIIIQIPSGMSSRKVADLLLEKNLIQDKKTFLKLLTKCDLENKIRAGRYELDSDISPLQLVLDLTGK